MNKLLERLLHHTHVNTWNPGAIDDDNLASLFYAKAATIFEFKCPASSATHLTLI